jgi:rfaE bifunctional protein kinase chain/domain
MKPVKITREKIHSYIEKIKQQKILVLGDLMLDEFIWGKVTRISPEAPVPVVHVTHQSAYPGGAANVARNLADFGIPVCVGGMLGEDAHGHTLMQILKDGNISTEGVVTISDFPTIVKTRIIARHQQVVRVDREMKRELPDGYMERLRPRLEKLLAEMTAVILEDYGKGFITQQLVGEIAALARANGTIVVADPNVNNPLDWSGLTAVKPNRQEAFSAAGVPFAEDEASLFAVGNQLIEKWRIPFLLITLSEEGMVLFHPPKEPYHTPTRAREVYDVSGAGDTAIAFFTAALSAGLLAPEAAEIANHAAGVVVGKLGTATLKPEELIKSFMQNG